MLSGPEALWGFVLQEFLYSFCVDVDGWGTLGVA